MRAQPLRSPQRFNRQRTPRPAYPMAVPAAVAAPSPQVALATDDRNYTPSGNPIHTLLDVSIYPTGRDRLSTADGSPITAVRFVNPSGTSQLLFGVYVEAFGASPSALPAVNGAAIQAAIDANAGPVLFQSGTYTTTMVTPLTGTILKGVGPTQSVLKLADGANTPIVKATSVNYVTVQDLGFDGNQRNQAIPTPGFGGGMRPIQFGEAHTPANNCHNITIRNVRVNRNGDGTKGNEEIHAGVFVYGGLNHNFDTVEVYGDDVGCGFIIWEADKWHGTGLNAHDINYLLLADPGDDKVNGYWIKGCDDWVLTRSTGNTLGGNFGGGQTTRYSRGLAVLETARGIVSDSKFYDCDQPVDYTGDDPGNVLFTISNCQVWGARAAGFKFANSARNGLLTNCVASDCGLSGFFASGPAAASLNPITGDITYMNCLAYNIGGNGVWTTEFRPAGFLIEFGDFDPFLSPLGQRYIGCMAIDRQAVRTMRYGFANEIPVGTDGRYNEAINCVSIGETVAAFKGMHAPRCSVGLTAPVSHGTAAWAEVAWVDAAKVDDGGMFASGTPTVLFARQAGTYVASMSLTWAANAVGQRGVRITKGAIVINGSQVLVDAAAAGETSLNTSVRVKLKAGENVRFAGWQSSGGNLAVQVTSGAMLEKTGHGPDLG